MTKRAKEISAFVTPTGLYQYKVTPFGMKNSAATFQRMVKTVIRDLEGCEGYIDDVVIYSSDWTEHLKRIKAFFERISKANLTINLVKSDFGQDTVNYLGHVVGQGQVRPIGAKVEAISNFSAPTSKKQLMRDGWLFRKFCLNFADVVSCLTNLLSKKEKFVWKNQCERHSIELKIC